ALEASGGNRTAAARRLGIQRQLLYAKIERYGLGAPADGARLSDLTTVAVANPDDQA
ncbi:helix-turn-helix domain-containing protein, partial [Methylobacterium sp. WL116]